MAWRKAYKGIAKGGRQALGILPSFRGMCGGDQKEEDVEVVAGTTMKKK